MIFNSKYGSFDVVLKRETFANGGHVLSLVDSVEGDPIARCNTWIQGLQENEIAVKDYSENEGMLNFLIENNIVEPPHRIQESGFVDLKICYLK